LTVEAIVGDTEIFTPPNRISGILRHPAVVQPQLVGPERGLDGSRVSGSNLARREEKNRYVRTTIRFREMNDKRRGVSQDNPVQWLDERKVIRPPRSERVIDEEMGVQHSPRRDKGHEK